jgi:hypothetical protein
MRRIRGCELGRSTEVAGLTGHWFMIRSDPSLHVSNQYLQRKSYSGMIGGWHLKVFASQKPCQSSRQRRPRSPLGPPAPVAWRPDKRRDFLRLLLAGARNTVPGAERPKHTVESVELVTKSKHTKSPPRPPTTLGGAGMASCNRRAQQESPTPIQTSNSATTQPRGCSRTLSAAVARVPSGLSLTVTPTHTGQQNKVATDWQSIGASPTPGPAREKKTRPLRRPWRPYSIFGRLVSGIGKVMFGALFS